MLVMPNNPSIIDTQKALKICESLCKNTLGRTIIDNKAWRSNESLKPDFCTIDIEGDVNMHYIVVTHVDPGDDIKEIAKGIMDKKTCKKMEKEYIRSFNDDLPVGSEVITVLTFLIVRGDSMDIGTLSGCPIHSSKVKAKDSE